VVFLFRDKSIANIFFLVILSIGVHLHFFINAPLVVSNLNDGFFSYLLANYVAGLSPTVLFMLYHLVILVQAIRLNLVLSDLRMFQNNSYTPAMAYVLLSGILTQWCSISPALIANFLLTWLFIKLCRLYNHPSPKTLLFNTGLIVGISVVCYHPTAILILVVLFALAVIRPFKLAEWVILLMGILLPYYFLAAGLFLDDKLSTFYLYLPYLQWNLPSAKWDIPLIVSLSVLLLVLIAGLYYWRVSSKRMVIQIRKNWGAMMVMLLILLPIPFIFLHAGIESAFMSLVPLGAFAGNAFSYPRRLVLPNILFWLCMAVIIYHNWWFIYHN
jgi:hypothetical protein